MASAGSQHPGGWGEFILLVSKSEYGMATDDLPHCYRFADVWCTLTSRNNKRFKPQCP
jgi:hypothetical protein